MVVMMTKGTSKALAAARQTRFGPMVGAALLASLGGAPSSRAEAPIRTMDPPEHGFFSRVLICDGIPIKAHMDVGDAAMREAARRIGRLLKDIPIVRDNLVAQGAEHHIIGKDQATSDLPEWRHMKGKMHWDNSALFDDRVRGMGGLISSSGEDNLLKLPTDQYRDHRDICSHEFSHAILGDGVSPDVLDRFEARFQEAKAAGLWPSYAGTNVHEYFAEMTMWYVGSRGDYGSIRPTPEPGPEWLKRYDPEGYALMDDFYRGRIKVKPLALKTLRPSAKPIVPGAPGTHGRRPTSILLLNNSSAPVHVFNVEPGGGRAHLMDVPPGARCAEDARAGQVWLVTRAPGAVVGYFRCTGERGRILIAPENPPVEGQGSAQDATPFISRELMDSLRESVP